LGRIGTTLSDFTAFVATSAVNVVRELVQGFIDIGRSLGDLIAAIARDSVDLVRKLVEAAISLGRSLVQIVRGLASLAGAAQRPGCEFGVCRHRHRAVSCNHV
jgi:hypothetical protein